jgi:site-specific recombinase XerD
LPDRRWLVVKVCVVDADALARSGRYGDADECARRQLALGLRQEMRFILDDDGAPARDLNEWLRQLPDSGSPAVNTWDGYARDFCAWASWLAARGSHWLAATKGDVVDYHAERLDGPLDRRLARRSWNRAMGALDNFYRWAVEEGLLAAPPFTYRDVRVWGASRQPVVVRRNMAMEKAGRTHASVKWLGRDYLNLFLNVGLSGLGPDGRDDRCFLGRNPARNRAAAELMSHVGLRQSEVSYLLVFEIPELPTSPAPFLQWELPASICKGGRRREVLLPRRTLEDVRSYMRLERALVAEEKAWRPRRPLLVTDPEPTRGRVDGRVKSWASLNKRDRVRLVLPDGSSPLLALQSTRRAGAPLLRWNSVFAEATRRCQVVEPNFPRVTPHMLRHTFAVHMLSWLQARIKATVERQGRAPGFALVAPLVRMMDPLLTLRNLLGHASVTTTEVYLQKINAARVYATLLDDVGDEETLGW